ncbi:hypothetical protein RIF29_06085 [Crotalaria pallida]|uniref:Uncharacterized protein n=1 Tax=Crotalaria pallida TaxID=3830 RepID=A0AAN9J3W0_CROPI
MAIVSCLVGLHYGHVIVNFKVDVCRYSRITIVMEWIGMHALMIYILAACNILPIILQGFYVAFIKKLVKDSEVSIVVLGKVEDGREEDEGPVLGGLSQRGLRR